MSRASIRCVAALALPAGLSLAGLSHAAEDVENGARAARACMACHSFAAGRHMTGPSLAGVWGRKAGTVDGFARYSSALAHSGIVWNEKNLDAWLKNPAAVVPGNTMVFAGIANERTRTDLLAYLQAVAERRVVVPDRGLPNLRQADAAGRVTAVRHCGDTYRVTTGDRESHTFWEFNLRFKTDGSSSGPLAGKPVIVGSGMRGDRASIVFSSPEEISTFIRKECP